MWRGTNLFADKEKRPPWCRSPHGRFDKFRGQIPEVFLRGCGIPENFIQYKSSSIRDGIEFYSCFISYGSEDKAFAGMLHDTLQGKGIRCWLDEYQIQPGDVVHEILVLDPETRAIGFSVAFRDINGSSWRKIEMIEEKSEYFLKLSLKNSKLSSNNTRGIEQTYF